jgi:plasmid stability protein
MPILTVRNVPKRIIKTIKARARTNGRSMEQEIRSILQSVAMDRQSACDQIEKGWKRQARPTRRQEVDAWIRKSRP